MIRVLPLNETFVKVQVEDFGVEQEFSEFFTFYAPGYKYAPKYRSGQWDGKIRLFNQRNKQIYKGLIELVIKFAKINHYHLEIDKSLRNFDEDFNEEQFIEFSQSLNIHSNGNPIDIRDYQYQACIEGLQKNRGILISPTGSGKSLIMYIIVRWLLECNPEERILIIVPTTMLVEQLFKDFVDYSSHNGWLPEEWAQLLYSGKDKMFTKNIMISTWQSLHAMKKNSYDKFRDIVERTNTGLYDEAHTYKATEVLGTLEQFIHTKRRIGTTGTIDDSSKINELSLIGLMGPIYKVTTTRQLIDEGKLTEIKIKVLKLNYPDEIRKAMRGADYDTEMSFLIGSEARNQVICGIAKKCTGTTLITFALVERHGKVLYEMMQSMVEAGRKVYFVYGGTDKDDREEIRKIVNAEKDSIIIASEKLFSTGVNIPSIANVIFSVPRKSSILVRQTIGRGIRLFDGKDYMTLYDIADDLSVGKNKNVTLRSLDDRMTIYIKDEFEYKVLDVDMARFYNS